MVTIKEIAELDMTSPHRCTALLAQEEKHHLRYVNWREKFPYCPEVSFQMAHNGEELFIRFVVDELHTAARMMGDNSQVCTDSCVEFFLSLDDTGYYNFEFSCIGVMMLSFRKSRPQAEFADAKIISGIRRVSSLGNTPFEERTLGKPWELLVAIPIASLFKHHAESWKGLNIRANVYKCGDKLSVPHYVSFAPIQTAEPDFHRPEYFVDMELQ